jgi:DNA-binding XRE family transcriptional regulator
VSSALHLSVPDCRLKIPPKARDIQKAKQKVAAELKAEGKTQADIGKLMGVARTTVETWLGNNDGAVIPSVPDCRLKISPGFRLTSGRTRDIFIIAVSKDRRP